ncbi:MAG: hypothetical protein Q4D90_06850 [bacterium]|nr:hypothetical protein [bacterium]
MRKNNLLTAIRRNMCTVAVQRQLNTVEVMKRNQLQSAFGVFSVQMCGQS